MTLNGDLEYKVIEESNSYPERLKKEVKSNQNTPGVKKGRPRTKQALLKKM